jgi:hypothetical protein
MRSCATEPLATATTRVAPYRRKADGRVTPAQGGCRPSSNQSPDGNEQTDVSATLISSFVVGTRRQRDDVEIGPLRRQRESAGRGHSIVNERLGCDRFHALRYS